AGFEPAGSTVTGWRALRTAPRGQIQMVKVRGEGSNLHRLVQSQEAYRLADPRQDSAAEGEGVEPSRLIARPFSRRLPSPIGLPFRSSCGGRNRTCNPPPVPSP